MLLQKLLDADVGYKYNFVTWKKLTALAAELHFTILNWSCNVPLPEAWFDFHKLDLSQLNELTGMFLHKKLGAIYIEEMREAFCHKKKLRHRAKGKGKVVAGKPAAEDEDDEFDADEFTDSLCKLPPLSVVLARFLLKSRPNTIAIDAQTLT
ncbi:hypothetical protein HYDPIDRAFT_34991 [Hydnomerulius pinastri MD-312]|nr:hypothetical protein HYDPIDRAFT_34991 [Hydnomerulius pinastri MD-312]